jgi:hypothetical protein
MHENPAQPNSNLTAHAADLATYPGKGEAKRSNLWVDPWAVEILCRILPGGGSLVMK